MYGVCITNHSTQHKWKWFSSACHRARPGARRRVVEVPPSVRLLVGDRQYAVLERRGTNERGTGGWGRYCRGRRDWRRRGEGGCEAYGGDDLLTEPGLCRQEKYCPCTLPRRLPPVIAAAFCRSYLSLRLPANTLRTCCTTSLHEFLSRIDMLLSILFVDKNEIIKRNKNE